MDELKVLYILKKALDEAHLPEVNDVTIDSDDHDGEMIVTIDSGAPVDNPLSCWVIRSSALTETEAPECSPAPAEKDGQQRSPSGRCEFCGVSKSEHETLQRWASNVAQDQCEGAYVEVTHYDAVRQALASLAPNHPVLQRPCPAFGVWASQRREIEELRQRIDFAKKCLVGCRNRITELHNERDHTWHDWPASYDVDFAIGGGEER